MAAWKLRPENTNTNEPFPGSIEWTLPVDLLLEIAARSDIRTLVRCAATCKLLRLDILGAPFLRRVTQPGGIVPPCIIAYINTHYDKTTDPPPPLSLIHPATPAAVSFLDHHLSSHLFRFAGYLHADEYFPLMSRGNLVLMYHRGGESYLSNLCVYDLITGHRTFLSGPPGIEQNHTSRPYNCVLLTAEDGIDCSFCLLFVILDRLPQRNACNIRIHTATSTCGTWEPAVTIHDTSGFSCHQWFERDAIVLHGGVIHWLVPHRGEIFTYNVCTAEQGIIKLPANITNFEGHQLNLGSYYSQDGKKLLRLFGAGPFKISMWHQLACGDWAPEPVRIDTEEKLRSLDPDIITGLLVLSQFMCSCERSNALLLRVYRVYRSASVNGRRTFLHSVFDLETKEMCVQEYPMHPFMPLELDLPSRLRSMKKYL